MAQWKYHNHNNNYEDTYQLENEWSRFAYNLILLICYIIYIKDMIPKKHLSSLAKHEDDSSYSLKSECETTFGYKLTLPGSVPGRVAFSSGTKKQCQALCWVLELQWWKHQSPSLVQRRGERARDNIHIVSKRELIQLGQVEVGSWETFQ